MAYYAQKAEGGKTQKETLGNYIKRLGQLKKKRDNTMSMADLWHYTKQYNLKQVKQKGKQAYQDAKANGEQETHYDRKDVQAEQVKKRRK